MFRLHHIQGIVIMTTGGSLIFSKYYTGACTPPASQKLAPREVQRDLNTALFLEYSKPQEPPPIALIVKNHLVVCRAENGVVFFVIGDENENMVFLTQVVKLLLESVRKILDVNVEDPLDVRKIEDKYELILLAIDETIDNGLLVENSCTEVAKAVEEVNISSVDIPGREALTRLNQLLQNSL